MAEQWAIWLSTAFIFLSLGILIFYIIPLQVRIAVQPKDKLTGLRFRLLLMSSFIPLTAAPIITLRTLKEFGIQSVFLSNLAALSVGLAFLGFSISLVSVYHYRKKE